MFKQALDAVIIPQMSEALKGVEDEKQRRLCGPGR
jgi:hypothetical protein